MPDGDKAHKKLHEYYQSAYKLICGNNFCPEEVSQIVLQAVSKDLQNYALPLDVLNAGVKLLPDNMPVSLVNWPSIAGALNILIQLSSHKIKSKDVALAALKTCLNELRSGHLASASLDHATATYLSRFYAARFAEVVPTNSQHHNHASHDVVNALLKEIAPHVQRGLAKMARQAVQSDTCRPRAPRANFAFSPITVETDLTAL